MSLAVTRREKRQKITNNISRSRGEKIGYIIICILLACLSFVMLYPFWHVLMYSISDPIESMRGGVFLYPHGFSLYGYKLILQNQQVWTAYRNTILKTLIGTLISLVITTLTAYPLSLRRLHGRSIISMFIFFTMLFSGGTIPLYLVIANIGMLNTFWALVIPGAMSAYNMFILRNYMQSLPSELEESAWIDGASPPVILVRIIVPLCTPSLAAIAMFYGIANWNSYMDCLLYTNTPKLQTLQLYLRNMLQQASTLELSMTVSSSKSKDYMNENALRMVTVSVSIIPVLIIYPFLQRYYTKGITIGAVKG